MIHRRFLITLAAAITMVSCATFMTSTAEAGCFGRWHRGYYGYGWGHRHVGWGGYYSSWYPRYYYTPSYYYGGYGYGCGCGVSCYSGCYNGCFSSNVVGVAGVAYATNTSPTYSSIASTTIRSTSTTASGAMQLKISVPEDARVVINDRATKSTGSERTYVVRGAQPGTSYTFVVRAEMERDGELVSETKEIVLRSGQTEAVAFNVQPAAQPAITADKWVNTSLKLHVPEDSKVFLAGTEMKQNSGVCMFETDRLAAGQKIEGYNVRVTFMADGQEQSIEKSLTLVGGEAQEVDFGSDPATRLASR